MTSETLIKIRCYAGIATWFAKTATAVILGMIAIDFIMAVTAVKCLDNPDWCSLIAQGKR